MMDGLALGFIVAAVVCLAVARHEKSAEERYWQSQGRHKEKIGDKWYWV